MDVLPVAELIRWLSGPAPMERAWDSGERAVIVDLGSGHECPGPMVALGTLPLVVIGVSEDVECSPLVDVVVPPARLESVLSAVASRPLAAVALALLLRSGDGRDVDAGLVGHLCDAAGRAGVRRLAGRTPGAHAARGRPGSARRANR
jgi:hypothetical protein